MIAELCVESYDHLTLPFSPGSDPARELFVGNCPVMLLDPGTYRREVLPADRHLRSQVTKFGLHHCGPMDRYLGDYQTLAPLEFLEVGWGSTVSRVRAAFPTTLLDLMINIPAVTGMSAASLSETLQEMIRQAAPRALIRDIFLADIGPDVADATVEHFVQAVNDAFA